MRLRQGEQKRSRVSLHRRLANARGAPPETLKETKNLKPGKKLVKCTSNCLLTQRNKKLKGTKQEPKFKSLDSPNWDKLTD